MARKSGSISSEQNPQLWFDFDEIIKSGRVRSREEVVVDQDYDPVARTADYMQRAVQFEEAWDTTIQKARQELLRRDPRELYLEFFTDLKRQIDQDARLTSRLAHLLDLVAVRGFGMSREQVYIDKPGKGGTRWKVYVNEKAVQEHLEKHIVGSKFLNEVSIDATVWKDSAPLIGASDVSQHVSAVPVPARYFKHSVPFVLNNAAGALFQMKDGQPKYDPVFNPRPDEELLRWMLLDPSYQEELEPEDYKRCVASAMDVGQYKFDLNYLLKADRRIPQLIFRDGSIFPQDAYLDNFVIDNRRGEFTREAVRELLSCLTYAQQTGVIYCGVSKSVQLKVYSAVVDWFIAKYVDKNWEIENYTLNDGRSMTLLLSSPSFVGDKLQNAITTCLIRRAFTTRANLNTKAELSDLGYYFSKFEGTDQKFDITHYKSLCSIANLYMFFIGHSKSPQQQLPRYEFFHHEAMGDVSGVVQKIFAAIQHCGLMVDEDHSFMSDQPITYLLPSVTQQAHHLSKDVGKLIDTETGQRIMARYKSLMPQLKGK
jgi:hypothetical protein